MSANYRIRKLINELADAVRAVYQIECPIQNMDTIVQSMGGNVIEDASIDGFSDGRIKKIDANSFEIAISPFQSSERRNFTIAHELGHLFIHMGFKTNPKQWEAQTDVTYYRNGHSELEYQANEFAAAFLMPESEFAKELNKNTTGDTVNTSAIASYFHVSIEAAANRGKWLGYLKW